MNSDRECFVYIVLPGETNPVTAGKLVIVENAADENIGRFVYGKSYLARPDAVPIDPVELTLSEKVYETAKMGGLFGAIRDASPDLWGRILIEKYLGRTDLHEMDYLLNSPDDRIGALCFGRQQSPTAPMLNYNSSLDLEQLQCAADAVVSADTAAGPMAQAEQLLLIGTSMGGARPKVVVSDRGALWVAKFAHPSDRYDMALAEHAMLMLARSCGINAAESRTVKVGRRNVLLVKRFDREKSEEGYLRHRMISALTVLRSDDNPLNRGKWSYLLIADELRRISAEPVKDLQELFRRMVFNALITNTDDHPRNHAFIADNAWRLSPAYDLVPFPMTSPSHRDLALLCGSQGRLASSSNLISCCRRFMYEPDEAKQIVADMACRISKNWLETARKAGMSVQDCNAIQQAFVYPGFFT